LRRVVEEPGDAAALAAMQGIDSAVAILIFPRCTLEAQAFDQWVQELRLRSPRQFALAPFHPRPVSWSQKRAEQMTMFYRRSPDPSIQLVRLDALEAVRGEADGAFLMEWTAACLQKLQERAARPPLGERIARDNLATVERVGIEKMEAVFAEIQADRQRSYSRFGVT
jgi:hypothetical protein